MQLILIFQFGFDSLFFGRLDFEDKDKRQNNTTMEMIWRGSPENLGRCYFLKLLKLKVWHFTQKWDFGMMEICLKDVMALNQADGAEVEWAPGFDMRSHLLFALNKGFNQNPKNQMERQHVQKNPFAIYCTSSPAPQSTLYPGSPKIHSTAEPPLC